MTVEERRRTDRLLQRIEIEYWCDGTRLQGWIGDLSEGGVYIYTGPTMEAKKQIEFLRKDIRHPSLRAKRRGGERRLWQGRITRGYRFYFEIVGNTYWIEVIKKHPK